MQKLKDCLHELHILQWGYDFQELRLTLRTEMPDFSRIQKALLSAGYVCNLLDMAAVQPKD